MKGSITMGTLKNFVDKIKENKQRNFIEKNIEK